MKTAALLPTSEGVSCTTIHNGE